MLRKLSHVLTAAVGCCSPAPLPAAQVPATPPPAAATCEALSVREAIDEAGPTPRHRLAGAYVLPFTELAVKHELPPLAMPDGVLVMAPKAAPLLVLLTRESCVVGASTILRGPVWRTLREAIGPAV